MKKWTPLGAACLGLASMGTWGSALAADPLTDAMNAAYPAYRAALFKTNTQQAEDSAQAIAKAMAAWQGLQQRFAAQAPSPYDRDSKLTDTLAQVEAVYRKAQQQIGQNALADAHETLEQARDLQADLRHRNGVVVYSDHMNAYHSAMEHALETGGHLTAEPATFWNAMAMAGELNYLAHRLQTEAPAEWQANPDFQQGLKAVLASVEGLRAAAKLQDVTQLKVAITQLKAPYSKLFVKFG